jgi:hypothetical protein
MASGQLVPPAAFDRKVRDELAALFKPHFADRLGPAEIADVLIRQLEEIAGMVQTLAAPDVAPSVRTIRRKAAALKALRRALDEPDLAADDMLASALAKRGRDREFLENLRHGLADLETALNAIEVTLASRRGGRPADSQKRWLAELTRKALNDAWLHVNREENGPLAETLRILWPAILKSEAPIELKPYL